MNEAIEARHRAIYSCFNSPDGKKVLEMLVEDFQKSALFDSDPLVMARNVGQYELVQYLKDMSKGKVNE